MSFYHFAKLISGLIGTLLVTSMASATCAPGQTCRISQSSLSQNTIPFSLPANTSISTVSSRTVPGLAPDERLCPVTCPVDVYNPKGGDVLGCYDICKPLAPYKQTHTVAKTSNVSLRSQQTRTEHIVKYEPYIVNPAPQTTHIRVIRPAIYVRYPVPVPVTPCGQVIHGTHFGC